MMILGTFARRADVDAARRTFGLRGAPRALPSFPRAPERGASGPLARPHPTVAILLALVFALLTVPLPASAQAGGPPAVPEEVTGDAPPQPVDPLGVPRPSLAVYRTDERVLLDGVLDEPAWELADSTVGSFWLALPRQGIPQEFRTTVRVVQTEDALIFGAVLYDPDPSAIATAGLEQDFETQDSDLFGVTLDTYHDRSNGFLWAVNSAGAVYDGQTFNDSREVEREWEGIVEVGTRVRPDGWAVELKIPFTTLRYRASDEPQTWGMNLFRRVRRRNEDAMWAALPRQFRPYKFSLAGTLTGLVLGAPPRNLSVKPYALGAATGGGALNGATTGDVGADLKWGVTPRLTLDVTLNTDFSQVEVDAEQVNLGRFSLFFPEKRDFFLENQGMFAFQDVSVRNFRMGSSPGQFKLFHSRRIGLSDDRRPVPILGGARLTGRVAGFEVGLLDMQTRESGLGPAENFAVARLRRGIGGVNVGGMLVHRQVTSGGGSYNSAFGADLAWSPRPELIVAAYGARTDWTGASVHGGDRNAAMAQVAWRDPLLNASVLVKHTGDAFRPGVGFVARNAVRRLFTTVGVHPQPDLPGVQEVNPYVDMDWWTDLDGAMETREITPGLGVGFLDGSVLTLEWIEHWERLDAPLRIAGGEVPAGTYDFGEAAVRYVSSGARTLSGSVTVRHGDFFDGRRTSVAGDLQLRPDPRISLTLGVQRNDLEIGGEELSADLYSLKAQLARDTRTFLLGFVQYNQATDEVVANVRFNLIHAPLSDLFVVFTERRSLLDAGEARLLDPDLMEWEGVRERGLTIKATRLVAF